MTWNDIAAAHLAEAAEWTRTSKQCEGDSVAAMFQGTDGSPHAASALHARDRVAACLQQAYAALAAARQGLPVQER